MSNIRALLDAGLVHHKAGRLSEAESLYQQVRSLEPENIEVNHLSGLLAFQNGNAVDAAHCFERAVAADPANVKYLGNLGAAWLISGRPDDALGVLERAIEIDPDGVDVLNNLAAAYRETGRFSDAVVVANRAVTLRPDDAELQTNFAIALLGTEESDAAMSAAQRAVDLSRHSAKNRLTVFARKPAPIQASWLGYMSTTGLTAIDYYIGDETHTPEEFDSHFSEKVYRLRRGLTCFSPPDDAPPTGTLPVASADQITFGCFGNPGKITDACLELWAGVLATVEGSRLILRYQGY
jgi:predicted O-linked N-acetylglucosamine transferase (SPINDLY family)